MDDEHEFDNHVEHVQRPVIIRTYGKPPKEYRFGEDFRAFIAKFILYAELNQIPEAQKAPLMFTLLDAQAFQKAVNLDMENFNDFDEVIIQLTRKLDMPGGPLGHQMRLKNRRQNLNESLEEYLEALIVLASKTSLEVQPRQVLIMDVVMEHAREVRIRQKLSKFASNAQERRLCHAEKWIAFIELIKRLSKLNSLETFSNSLQTCDSEQVNEISNKLDKLMLIQQQAAQQSKLKIKPPSNDNIPQIKYPKSREEGYYGGLSANSQNSYQSKPNGYNNSHQSRPSQRNYPSPVFRHNYNSSGRGNYISNNGFRPQFQSNSRCNSYYAVPFRSYNNNFSL